MNALENTLTLPTRSTERRLPRSARVVLALLEKIAQGTLEVRLPDGSQQRFGQPGQHDVMFEVDAWSVVDSVLERGDVGFAEAWINGDWRSPPSPPPQTMMATRAHGKGGTI